MKKICLIFLLLCSQWCLAQKLFLQQLSCDYRTNPLGIENPHPAFSWQLICDAKNITQSSYQILVATDSFLLKKNQGNIWNSGKVHASSSIQVRYQGKPLQATKKYYWKLMVTDNRLVKAESSIQYWQMGLLQPSDWKNAEWIAYAALPDSNIIVPHVALNGKKSWGKRPDILPLFRKEFTATKKIKSATAFVSGLGQFEMYLNGQKIGDHFLDPGWTNYSKQALYISFDLTQLIQPGKNAIGMMLGNGFYYIPSERYRKMTGAFGYPKMICRLLIEYTDGTSENIVSNQEWKTTASPILFSSIFGGEDYDASKEIKGWGLPNFQDAGWKHAIKVSGHPLESQTAEPVKVMQTFEPIKTTKLKANSWVFDMAQNMSGIPQIKVRGRRGDTIKIIPAELLNENGTANQTATGKTHLYQYILKGDSVESWQPRFTYYGFRYLQIENVIPIEYGTDTATPQLLSVKGLHIRNAARRVGAFSSSNELFNQTDRLIDWSVKSNMVSVFTDCPHREKLGWLEETYLVGSSIKYAYDIASLCRKAILDMRMAQTKQGLVPEISPEFLQFDEPFRDSPEWGGASIILPWYLYQWYGDKAILTEQYASMQQYLNYLQSKDSSRILKQGLSDWYDLGPNRPGFSQLTPQGLTATAVYYQLAEIMQQIADLLGKQKDRDLYSALKKEIKTAFNQAFYNATTHQYGSGSQTSNAMALYLNLVDEENRKAVEANLVKEIQGINYALTAGDIGFKYLLKELDAMGRSDLIYQMNNRSDVPGYGYQIARGATALTESWQALPTVSNNHLMLGHIMEWFYEGLAGISQAEGSIAYKTILIRPQIVGDLLAANAHYESPYGLIASKWELKNNAFILDLSIPANTRAIVYLPAHKNAVIKVDGGIKNIPVNDQGKAILKIGSGNYHIEVN